MSEHLVVSLFFTDNIALGKHAKQLYPIQPSLWAADLAVDGMRSDLSSYGEQCTISADEKQTAKWWVDLGGVLSIHHITIYYRTENKGWGSNFQGRFLGFHVYVSNTTSRRDGHMCFRDTSYTKYNIPQVANITCLVHGQYVIYYNERLPGTTYPYGYSRYAFNELCEVEVYGCPVPGYYGSNCSVPCPDTNCRYCHIETGACQGCKPGYQGHQCGLQNLAFQKPSQQLYSYYRFALGADRVVDGMRSDLSFYGGQCTLSRNSQQTAKWWVDLGRVVGIHHITIYYRTENNPWDGNEYRGRFLGFHVYISNTTSRQDGHLCFRDKSYTLSTIPAVANITCLVHGQYVIYYNERLSGTTYPDGYSSYAYNDLCEVEVYGCSVPGYYGSDCSVPCPDRNCRHCHIQTGACYECKPGYQGHRCESLCSTQYYGEICKQTCGNCSDGVTCNNVDGTCPNGCDVGVYGDKCKTLCPVGWYGKKCSLPCGGCDTCSRFTGQCTSPCYPGWKGTYCTEKCDGRKYGAGCNKDCGTCLGYTQCHHINGSCLQGCHSGYQGELCKTVCMTGYYGHNCTTECSLFCKKPRICNHVSGHCNDGCVGGWQGLYCQRAISEKKSDNPELSRFYGMLAALSVCVTVIAVLVTYICIKRRQYGRRRENEYLESDESQTGTVNPSTISGRGNERRDNTYLGLSELGPSSTYDTLR
ncbi:uncharacterized protein LOC130049702 [Ostrea edulis]|uniref:uncharacterized protein LOC130049702 n=1 Tax=Ostrea edulis TaxID=37623 RepID=UPI0024AF6C41|nr:uncharacterized protein LOC130049702 [Ostrea edulis]